MIPGDLLIAYPHRQFHTLPDLLDSWAALPNSYPNALRAYAGRQFVPFLWWSLVWPSREANSRPTVREADTLPTEPTRHGLFKVCKQTEAMFQPSWKLHLNICLMLWVAFSWKTAKQCTCDNTSAPWQMNFNISLIKNLKLLFASLYEESWYL